MLKLLQTEEDKCADYYAGDYAGDAGANGFASDEELYAEKTRKQMEFQKGLRHASPLALSPSPCTATNEGPCRMTVGAKPDCMKLDDEISNEMKSKKADRESMSKYAAPEHKKDRESIYAAPEHKADHESMSEPVACEGKIAGCRQLTCCRQSALTGGEAGKKGEFVPGKPEKGKSFGFVLGESEKGKSFQFVPFAPISPSTSENISKGAGREMPDVGAGGFASDEELYAEKARKQLEAKIGAKQLGSKENAARFRPGSADGRSSASTRIMSRNCAKKLRQRANKERKAG